MARLKEIAEQTVNRVASWGRNCGLSKSENHSPLRVGETQARPQSAASFGL